MGRYINLFTDFGFKKIFGSEENKDILLDFLNTLLADKQLITEVSFLNTERLGNSILDRKAIFDLYCQNDKGEKFIVELQRAEQEFFKERSIFYAARAIEDQAKRGKWNYNWEAVYTIAIMDFEFSGMGHDSVESDVILYDRKNEMEFTSKLRFIYLEMPKFNKTLDELETTYDKWLFLLKNISELDEAPKRLQRFVFQRIFNIAEYVNFDEKDRKEYEESLKEYRDYYNTIATAERKARAEGKAEGREEGRSEEKKALAQMMKQNGELLEKIIAYTGLSKEEIQGL